MATRPSRGFTLPQGMTMPRGFTLIELMVVIAIVGILSALSVSTYIGIGQRAAPQNAAYDLSSALSRGRARAAERNSNVYLVLFPNAGHNAAGKGAWVLYEDVNGTFSLSGITAPEQIINHPTSTSDPMVGMVLDQKFMDDYPAKNAAMDVPASGSPAETSNKLDTPYPVQQLSSIRGTYSSTRGCSFCTGSGQQMRGAVVFMPEGTAHFKKSDDTQSTASPGIFVLTDSPLSGSNMRSFIFAISRATSYVGFYPN